MGTVILDGNNPVYDPTAADAEPIAKMIHHLATECATLPRITSAHSFGQNPLEMPKSLLPSFAFSISSLTGERTGIQDIFSRDYLVGAELLWAEYDKAATSLRPTFIEPLAQLTGGHLFGHFNDGAGAHERRKTLCAAIDCEDIRLLEASYEWIGYGTRVYVGWQLTWKIGRVRLAG